MLKNENCGPAGGAGREGAQKLQPSKGEGESGRGPNGLFGEFNPIHQVSNAYLVSDAVLGVGDPGMVQMQERKRGRGSYRDDNHNTGDKCLGGVYKMLWELNAQGH